MKYRITESGDKKSADVCESDTETPDDNEIGAVSGRRYDKYKAGACRRRHEPPDSPI